MTEHNFIPAEEWDFRQVPDEERNACLIWEYSRESPTVEALAMRWADYFHRGTTWHTKHQEPHDEKAKAELAALDAEQRELWMETRSFTHRFPTPPRDWNWEGMVSSFGRSSAIKRSWISLPSEKRKDLALRLGRGPAVFTADATVQLSMLSQATHGMPYIDLPDGTAESPKASAMDEWGREIVAIVIDWTTYSDVDLQRQLIQWIKGRRPKGVEPFLQSGKGVRELRTACKQRLEWLGKARLNAWAPPSRIRSANGAAWDWLTEGKENTATLSKVRRTLRLGTQAFLRTFRAFFPQERAYPHCVARIKARR